MYNKWLSTKYYNNPEEYRQKNREVKRIAQEKIGSSHMNVEQYVVGARNSVLEKILRV